MRPALAAVLVVVALVAGCAGGDEAALRLDGSARVPDAEGVVQSVDHSHITLEGHRYRLSGKLQAFSTYTLEAVPVIGRNKQYVQVGLDGDTVVWLAAFGAVVRAPGAPPTVYYTGILEDVDGGRAVFRDGSSVRLGTGVSVPERGTRVRVEIDPDRQRVRALTAV
jgi:hypothetical protein